jgi:hypothetical protein
MVYQVANIEALVAEDPMHKARRDSCTKSIGALKLAQ